MEGIVARLLLDGNGQNGPNRREFLANSLFFIDMDHVCGHDHFEDRVTILHRLPSWANPTEQYYWGISYASPLCDIDHLRINHILRSSRG
jgi:hypothetical protein